MNAHGFGFVTPEDDDGGGDLYIATPHLCGALHGDLVKAKVISRASGEHKRRGRVMSILEKANRRYVCTLRAEYGMRYAECDDPQLPYFVHPVNAKRFNLKAGTKVLIDIIDAPKHRPALHLNGKIVKVLGDSSDAGIDILSLMLNYGLPRDFPSEVLAEAAKVEQEPSVDEINRRIDRRHLNIVTIDGADAKDLDDGVYAERTDDGFFLGVYIADVSHYVRDQSVLDVEAAARGTSVYLVDRVLPMLPKELSNGICSLNAGVDRLSMACEMNLNADGRVETYKIFPTVINVRRRLTYDGVNALYNGERSELTELEPMLMVLKEIRDKRYRIRERRGAIDFDMPEIKVLLDADGRPLEIVKRRRDLAESVIEECMLVANETVARHLCTRKLPGIYRVHEPPSTDNLKKFNELLNAFGFHLRIRDTVQPIDFQKLLTEVKGKRGEQNINAAALRTMQQARYSAQNSGHFGLAAEYYTHFTSPIRRYPDLIVHRLLKDEPMSDSRRQQWRKRLPEIAATSSLRERIATDAERDSTNLKAVEYMSQFVGEIFDGVINSIVSFGFFVELDNGVDGLVRATSIRGDDYLYIEREFALIGMHTGRAFRIGDNVTVKLVDANIRLKQLTFVLN